MSFHCGCSEVSGDLSKNDYNSALLTQIYHITLVEVTVIESRSLNEHYNFYV